MPSERWILLTILWYIEASSCLKIDKPYMLTYTNIIILCLYLSIPRVTIFVVFILIRLVGGDLFLCSKDQILLTQQIPLIPAIMYTKRQEKCDNFTWCNHPGSIAYCTTINTQCECKACIPT